MHANEITRIRIQLMRYLKEQAHFVSWCSEEVDIEQTSEATIFGMVVAGTSSQVIQLQAALLMRLPSETVLLRFEGGLETWKLELICRNGEEKDSSTLEAAARSSLRGAPEFEAPIEVGISPLFLETEMQIREILGQNRMPGETHVFVEQDSEGRPIVYLHPIETPAIGAELFGAIANALPEFCSVGLNAYELFRANAKWEGGKEHVQAFILRLLH